MDNILDVLDEAMDLLTAAGKEHTLENLIAMSLVIKNKYNTKAPQLGTNEYN